MKKVLSLILVAMLSIALAACGSSEKADTPKKEESSSSSDSNEKDKSTDDSNEVEEQETEKEEPEEVEVPKEAIYAEALIDDLKLLTEDQLELSQESYDFIVANHTLFPAKTDEAIAAAKQKVDSSITIKHLNKNPQPYFQKIASFQGDVVSIEEEPLENGETIAVVHVFDDEMNSYQVLMYKSTGDILEDDVVRFWGVPVGGSSFENVSGGITNVQNFFGSHIEKVN